MSKKKENLEQQIKEAIEASGLTCYEIAKRSGVPQPVLSRFVNDKRGINLSTASKLADAFGLELRPRQAKRKGG